MNNTEWLNHMANNKAQVNIYANLYTSGPKRWSCKLEIEEDGSTLTVKSTGAITIDEAIEECRHKYDRVCSGSVRFTGPMLEYIEGEAATIDGQDEIPF